MPGDERTGSPATRPLEGRTVLVTGATSGIGYFTAEQLAGLGARVILAARNPERAAAATASIERHVPGAVVVRERLDLADLASVRSAAASLAEEPRIDAIVANAGVIGYPGTAPRAVPSATADGFEIHFGTNHLGHFALIAALSARLPDWGTRVVHVGSLSHSLAKPPFDNAARPSPERDFTLYARSKLAVTMFGFELARRFAAAGSTATSVVAHPGAAVDVLASTREGVPATQPPVEAGWRRALVAALLHGKDAAARTLVHAAGAPDVRNGDFWGPAGAFEVRGAPARRRPRRKALDPAAGAALVRLSEDLTGVRLAV